MTGSRAAAGYFTSRRAACSAIPKKQNLLYKTVGSLRLAILQRSIMKARSTVGFCEFLSTRPRPFSTALGNDSPEMQRSYFVGLDCGPCIKS